MAKLGTCNLLLQLYICDGPMDSNVFTGEKFRCPDGEMVVLDTANGNPLNYTCVDRTLREYHFPAGTRGGKLKVSGF